MASIPKIVSIPIKWASKEILNRTLLRFPGGDSHSPIACTYCPEMCRFSCPTAVVSANDAVTPCNKNSLLYKEEKWPGQASQGGPLWPIYDCTGCGRCTEYCVYGMPVADQLFSARKTYSWEKAAQVAASIGDAEDPYGDLADELGDDQRARTRLTKKLQGAAGTTLEVSEPKVVFFLGQRGHAATLSWGPALTAETGKALLADLAGKRWLVHESVWLSRRLDRAKEVLGWVETVRSQGTELVLPAQHGKDCLDCGGEGAYSRLFSEQAAQMVREIWERDRHRADGILCFSERCAAHLRSVLGVAVPVVSVPGEWLRRQA